MKKEIVNKINEELKVVIDWDFDSDNIEFVKETDSGFTSIQFHEYKESQTKLFVTLSIRFNDIENIINFYKLKYKLSNSKYFGTSTSISVNLINLVDKEFFLDYTDDLSDQLLPYLKSEIFPFFERYSDKKLSEKLLYDEDILKFVEPIRSVYKVVFSYVNRGKDLGVLNESTKILNNLNSMSVRMYRPAFEDICDDIKSENIHSL